eukprot:TRINITY_DN27599_c0_g1_i1.p1 TRINITY_DN27599_c0_g1~~TRINITY_DN27599_c0_g1_i1.p1  ORF type:complete len:448 (-),score=89.05 TRINITY_DN27599_c0_g1_i1:171-1421(-)
MNNPKSSSSKRQHRHSMPWSSDGGTLITRAVSFKGSSKPQTSYSLSFYLIEGGDAKQTSSKTFPGIVLLALFSGPILGISITHENNISSFDRKNRKLKFFSWKEEREIIIGVDPHLLAPFEICWDPTQNFVALLYHHQLKIYKTHPFKLLFSSSEVVISSIWYNHTFVFMTLSGLKLCFVHEKYSKVITVTSFDSSHVELVSNAKTSGLTTTSGIISGTIRRGKILGIFRSQIIIFADDEFFCFDISTPEYKFYFLAQAGLREAADKWVTILSPPRVLECANFLVQRGFSFEALGLPLTPDQRLSLCFKYGLHYSIPQLLETKVDSLLLAPPNHKIYQEQMIEKCVIGTISSLLNNRQFLKETERTIIELYEQVSHINPQYYLHWILFVVLQVNKCVNILTGGGGFGARCTDLHWW